MASVHDKSDPSASIARVAELVQACTASASGPGPKLVAITGSVAVGKSTFAGELAAELARRSGQSVEVVATDGFLRSEQELSRAGLLERKGFPESYDAARFAAFLRDVAQAAPRLHVPVYSHRTRSADELRDIPVPRWLLLEGVYVVQPIRAARLSACMIFVEADPPHVRKWYFARRRALRDPGADHAALDALAERAWDGTNVPNYAQHIALQRADADIVVRKAADHSLSAVLQR